MGRTKKLTKAEIREAQAKAGRARYGTGIKPRKSDVVSAAGYRVPEFHARFKMTKHLDRNREIVRKVHRASDTNRQKVALELAEKFGISIKTVFHVARYFREPE